MIMELRRYSTPILMSSVFPSITMTKVVLSMVLENHPWFVLCIFIYETVNILNVCKSVLSLSVILLCLHVNE